MGTSSGGTVPRILTRVAIAAAMLVPADGAVETSGGRL